MYNIEFYEDSNGRSELWEFLESLRVKAATNKDARIQYKQISLYIQLLEDNGTRLNEIITKHLDDDIWELRPGNNCVLYFISKSYTSKNGKQEENHSFLLLSRYHIPSRFYQSGPFQSTDATPGLKRCMIESKSRSDPDKDSDIFINRQAAEKFIYRQARIITLRYRKSK